MRRTVSLVITLLAILLGLVWVLSDRVPNEPASEAKTRAAARGGWRVEHVDEGTALRVVSGSGTEVLRYSIDAFTAWTTAHWDEVFAKRPSFGEIRPVDFDSFRQFDAGVALSPSGEMLAFSVSDYAAATTLSFVAFLDVDADTVALVGDVKRGQIDDLRWSPGGDYVAYRLHTARAYGDGLSVDRAAPPQPMVTLTGRDVLATLDTSTTNPSAFQPAFDDLTWTDEEHLSVTSRAPNGKRIRWRMAVDNGTLTKID